MKHWLLALTVVLFLTVGCSPAALIPSELLYSTTIGQLKIGHAGYASNFDLYVTSDEQCFLWGSSTLMKNSDNPYTMKVVRTTEGCVVTIPPETKYVPGYMHSLAIRMAGGSKLIPVVQVIS